MIAHMYARTSRAKLRYLPYYARPSPSIMPGQTWRDTGHKALCPVSKAVAREVPCALHGSNIEQVEFYLTADGRPIDLQGGVFSATLVISWPDPGIPQAGSAGAFDVIANAQNVYRR